MSDNANSLSLEGAATGETTAEPQEVDNSSLALGFSAVTGFCPPGTVGKEPVMCKIREPRPAPEKPARESVSFEALAPTIGPLGFGC